MTQVTTSATYKTKVTADLPDFGSRDITFRLVAAFFNAAGEEVIDGTTYTMTLDAAGNDDGAFYLPTPDNTGAAGANWFVTLPSGFEDIVTVAYSATAQAVSDLLAAGSTTTDPDVITAALAGKQAKDLTATNGYLAIFASGQTVAGAGAPGTAAYAATGAFDAAGSAAAVADAVNVFSVRTYGAAGDGTADDTSAIQDAVDALPSGGTLYFPAGRYRVTDTITLKSDMSIVGEGKFATVLVPDETTPLGGEYVYVMLAGPTGAKSNISVRGIGVDGVNRPLTVVNGFGRLRFNYVSKLSITDVSMQSTHGGLVLSECENFIISDVFARDDDQGVVTLFNGCKKGKITDILCYDMGEVIDFYNNEDILVSDVVAYGSHNPRNDEAFDLSSSRRVTITNCIISGFYKGIYIKREVDAFDISGIIISNNQIYDFGAWGIVCNPSQFGSEVTENIQIINNICESSYAGSQNGILVTGPDDPNYNTLIIRGNICDSLQCGILSTGYQNVTIADNEAVTSGEYEAIKVSACTDLKLTGNRVYSPVTGISSYAIYVGLVNGVNEVSGNRVFGSGAGGLYVGNVASPAIVGNIVENTGRHGLYVEFTSTDYVDATNLLFGAIIRANKVIDWGGTVSGRTGILFSSNLGAGQTGTYKGLVIADNICIISAYAANSQVAYSITKGSLAGFDYSVYARNIAVNVPGVSTGTTDFGSNSDIGGVNVAGTQTITGAKTFDNDVSIGTSTNARSLYVRGPSGSSRGLAIRTAFTNRWLLRANTTAESGSDAGSNFELIAVGDAGTTVDTPIAIPRAAGGAITLGGNGRNLVVVGQVRLTSSLGVAWASGSGSPEGAVTAPVGSLYSRTDGGTGTSLYVKESGTGNTGWVAK